MKQILDNLKLRRENNTLKLKIEELKEIVKCELYKEFIKQFVEVEKVNSLILEKEKWRKEAKKWKHRVWELEAIQKHQKANTKATK